MEEDFTKAAKDDIALSALLTDIADDVRGGPAPKRFLEVAPTDILWMAAAYAVWSLAKIGVDYLRGKTALQLTKEKADVMKGIMDQYGLGLKQSKDLVDKSLEELTKRSADDPLLGQVQKLIGGKKDQP